MKTRSIIFKFIVEIKIIYPILFLKSIVLVSRNTVTCFYGYKSVAKTMSLFDNLRITLHHFVTNTDNVNSRIQFVFSQSFIVVKSLKPKVNHWISLFSAASHLHPPHHRQQWPEYSRTVALGLRTRTVLSASPR